MVERRISVIQHPGLVFTNQPILLPWPQLDAGERTPLGRNQRPSCCHPVARCLLPQENDQLLVDCDDDPYKVDPRTQRPSHRRRGAPRRCRTPFAELWSTSASNFQIRANIAKIIDDLGLGVYLIVVWGKNSGESKALTNYAVFVD